MTGRRQLALPNLTCQTLRDARQTSLGAINMTERERISYWATIELYRTWLLEDGPFLARLKNASSEERLKILHEIAISYSVRRTIPAAPENAETKNKHSNLEVLVKAIDDSVTRWPSDFLGRAEECRNAARNAAKNFDRAKPVKFDAENPGKGAPHSAVTKLVWFLKPDGWTVYDRLASSAVLPDQISRAHERQEKFYKQIEHDFAIYEAIAKPILARFEPRLHAGRLVDKFLVLRGDDAKRIEWEQRNQIFLQLIPSAVRDPLISTASEIAAGWPDCAFPKMVR